jgi:hypothetical protein
MALITAPNMQQWTDYLAAVYDLELAQTGSSSGSVVAGTARNEANKLLTFTVGLADIDQETDLNLAANAFATGVNVESFFQQFQNVVAQLDQHCLLRGNKVVGSGIIDVPSFLTYYNGGSGGALFSAMLTPSFAAIYLLTRARNLPAAGVLQPAINPTNGAASGMGTFNVAGAVYVAGAAVNALYSACLLDLVITANWGGGAGAAVVTATGVDHTGAAMTWTFTVPQNVAAALSGQTITPAINAQVRQTVAMAPNANGVVPGSWITLNNGLADQERVLVEVVAGANVTFVAQKAHLAGATVSGNYTIAGVPGTGGRRAVSISAIALTTPNSHTSGQCRVEGVQDRVAI